MLSTTVAWDIKMFVFFGSEPFFSTFQFKSCEALTVKMWAFCCSSLCLLVLVAFADSDHGEKDDFEEEEVTEDGEVWGAPCVPPRWAFCMSLEGFLVWLPVGVLLTTKHFALHWTGKIYHNSFMWSCVLVQVVQHNGFAFAESLTFSSVKEYMSMCLHTCAIGIAHLQDIVLQHSEI